MTGAGAGAGVGAGAGAARPSAAVGRLPIAVSDEPGPLLTRPVDLEAPLRAGNGPALSAIGSSAKPAEAR